MLQTKRNLQRSAWPYLFGLGLILLLAWLLYLPGVAGGFLFDDYPNLKGMEQIAAHDTFLNGVISYLEGGFSGPTRRPVALASFLLEYPSWPFDPTPFKRNNILLHLATALLVFWFALLVGERAGFSSGKSGSFALIVAALFALHPLHVSTVLYVVQRMAILATFFSLAALITYLKAVKALHQGRGHGWPLLFLFYPLFVMVAIFSKETGVLVAFFTAVIATCLPLKGAEKSVGRLVVRIATYTPAALLLLAMAAHFTQIMMNDPELRRRDFTVIERLLTQPRVIFAYLYDLFVPKIQSSGLYHDNFVTSRSLLSPPSTLAAIACIFTAIGFALWKRRLFPFLALAILGYFAGHALESTYIGLEMYFEHRNYMPSIFIFMGIAVGLIVLAASRLRAAALAFVVVIGWLTFATYQQVQLWKDPLMLSLIWAEKSGGSERSLLDAANHLQRDGYVSQALPLVQEAIAKNPDSARAVLYGLAMQCRYGTELDGVSMSIARQRLVEHVYHQATYNYLKEILREKEKGNCTQFSIDELKELVVATFSANGIRSGNIKALKYYELGNLELLRKNGQAALENYRQALALRNDVQVGVVEVARLASAGFPALALEHIESVRAHNARVLTSATKIAGRHQYQWVTSELNRLERLIQGELSAI